MLDSSQRFGVILHTSGGNGFYKKFFLKMLFEIFEI
jgi:hypothetical protein